GRDRESTVQETPVLWNGERSAKGIFRRQIFEQLQATQPEILKRIEKLITRFPDSRNYRELWHDLHDGEFGYNPEKRTVRIKLKKELIIDGETIHEIHVQGVLFTHKGYQEKDK